MLMCASDLAPEHEGHAVVEGAYWQADLRTRKGMVKRTFREKQTALTSKNIHLCLRTRISGVYIRPVT